MTEVLSTPTAVCWRCEGRKTVRTGATTLRSGRTMTVITTCPTCGGDGKPERVTLLLPRSQPVNVPDDEPCIHPGVFSRDDGREVYCPLCNAFIPSWEL